MTGIAVKGIGVVGGFGCGVGELAQAMKEGARAPGSMTVPTGEGARELPVFRAETGRLEDFVSPRSLRRVDRYSRLALLGAELALEDAALPGIDRGRLAVIIASGCGAAGTTVSFVDSMMSDGDACASPTHFANSIHSTAAANVSMVLGAKGPNLTVSQGEMSVPSALTAAACWLREGRVDAVLVGGVDELSDLMGYLWLRARAPWHGRKLSPLEFEKESSLPGEGAAFLLLTRADGGDSYCSIDSIELGRSELPPLLPQEGLLLLGADGRKELGGRYRSLIESGSRVACYSHLYGTMPAAAGLDLACAALALRDAAHAAGPLAGCEDTARICAVRFAGSAEYSLINLSRAMQG